MPKSDTAPHAGASPVKMAMERRQERQRVLQPVVGRVARSGVIEFIELKVSDSDAQYSDACMQQRCHLSVNPDCNAICRTRCSCRAHAPPAPPTGYTHAASHLRIFSQTWQHIVAWFLGTALRNMHTSMLPSCCCHRHSPHPWQLSETQCPPAKWHCTPHQPPESAPGTARCRCLDGPLHF